MIKHRSARALCRHRRFFSTTLPASFISPYRTKLPIAQSKADVATRDQSTATQTAPKERPIPSPAFQQESRNNVQPLQHVAKPEMDESFVGLSGGEILHQMLIRQGVKHVFGYPGGAILPVFDAIYNSKHFDFILPRHEQGAGHMAEGYARASGKPGVVIVTSGPGATNVITPIQDALSDGTPLVVFSGQVVTSAIGSDAFQEADILGISREDPGGLRDSKDVQAAILRRPIPMSSTLPSRPSAASLAARELSRRKLGAAVQRVARLVNIAKKPVIYAGQGVLASPEGPELLREFADKACIPVTTTVQGLGVFDEHDDKSLHMLGMHGSPYANLAMQEADLIVALGARFDDRVTGSIAKFAPQAKRAAAEGVGGICHFEIMPKNINKVVQATEAVEGDVATNLALLLPHVQKTSSRPEWFSQINDWKERLPFAYEKETPDGLIKPQSVIEKLSELTADIKHKTIITTGVGQHQMWTAQV
ncbi:MAG: hypothetical protein Q9188_006737 [Gyalolechia gomerana]